MPRDSVTGIYTVPAGTAAVTGQTIAAPAYNNFLNDISTAISQSIATTGQTPMAGNLNMNQYRIMNVIGPPQAPGDATNQLYVDSQSQFGGFQNKLHNGSFDIWQRGPGPFAVAASGYLWSADGWICSNGAGATVNAAQGAGRFLTYNSYQITGGASVGTVTLSTRIEAAVAVALQQARCTFQCWVYNGTSNPFTPAFIVQHANAVNNFSGGVTTDVSVNLQPCPVGAWTLCAYTFTGANLSANGLQINIQFPSGALASSGYIARIAEVDLRITPNVAVGLNASPPPFEIRPVATELAYCQRYMETSLNNASAVTASGQQFVFLTGLTSAANTSGAISVFKVTKLNTPTIFMYSPVSGLNGKVRDNVSNVDVTPTVANIGLQGFFWYASMSAAGVQINLTAHWIAYVPDLGGG